MAKFEPLGGNAAPAAETESLQQSFQFSLNVVAHMSADLEQLQASVGDLVRNKIRWPGNASDVEVSLQESQESGAEYHMEEHTDTPSRAWNGTISVQLDSPADPAAVQSAALLAETENLVDDRGNIRFLSLGD